MWAKILVEVIGHTDGTRHSDTAITHRRHYRHPIEIHVVNCGVNCSYKDIQSECI